MNKPESVSNARRYLSAYALIFTFLFITHAFLLRLPYFWDEAGYFIPAARDLLLTGSLIPHTTLSNAHPPLVMLWLAFWWKFSAFTPTTTREAMLMVAAFALLGLWRLARNVAPESVALATVFCTALYPVFFTQSSHGPPRHDGRSLHPLGTGDVCRAPAGGDHRLLLSGAAGERNGDRHADGAALLGAAASLR